MRHGNYLHDSFTNLIYYVEKRLFDLNHEAIMFII